MAKGKMMARDGSRSGSNLAEYYSEMKKTWENISQQMQVGMETFGKQLSNVFRFCEEAFGDGQEVLILVTELTINTYAARFISRYGCEEYFNHNKELLFYQRQKELIQQIEKLDWKLEE